MKFVPVITSDHIKATGESFGRSSAEWLAGICNKAMEIALAEQATQEQPLITAEEARKLGAGNAEWLTSKGNWCMCGAKDFLSLSIGGEVIKYRAIKKEVPAEPTVLRSDFDFCMEDKQRAIKVLEDTYKLICEDKLHEAKELLEKRVNNLMVNIPPFIEPAEPHAELKALYAQQFQRKTLDCYLWEFLNENGDYQHCFSAHDGIASEPLWLPHKTYRCTPKPTCQVQLLPDGEVKTMTQESAQKLQAETPLCDWRIPNGVTAFSHANFSFTSPGIYTYKLKANLVKLDGVLMSREAAEVEAENHKTTKDLAVILNNGDACWVLPEFINESKLTEYQLRPKGRKPVSWKDMPVGVMTSKGELRCVFRDGDIQIETKYNPEDGKDLQWFTPSELTLAPADQQNWIAVQDTFEKIAGLVYATKADAGCGTSPHDIAAFKVIGIAEGWVLK